MDGTGTRGRNRAVVRRQNIKIGQFVRHACAPIAAYRYPPSANLTDEWNRYAPVGHLAEYHMICGPAVEVQHTYMFASVRVPAPQAYCEALNCKFMWIKHFQ